jgi:hypothetical protein
MRWSGTGQEAAIRVPLDRHELEEQVVASYL